MKIFSKLALICFCASPAFADATAGKLNDLSARLISSFTAKTAGKTVIAIFPLNTDEKLAKRKVGFAVSEILSRKFFAGEKFTVVERGDIDKMLAEQKLQASGVVGADSAVSIGKIIGAKVILTGNVLKIDGQYQVNIRLVDAESSEVLGSGYAELDSKAFDEEARSYLNLVPEEQALGIYFLYNYRHNTNNLPVQNFNRPFGTVTVNPSPFTLALAGGGIRYLPTAKLMIDLGIMGNGDKTKAGAAQYSSGWSDNYTITVLSYRGLLSLKTKISDKFVAYTGAGITTYTISGGAKVSYTTPTINARLEFKPQSRIGLSIAGGYDLKNKASTNKEDGVTDASTSRRVRLDKFYIEPTLSFYF